MNGVLELTTAQALPDRALSDGFWYNALPVGTFQDPRYGRVEITPDMCRRMAANFGKAPAYPPPVKLGHGDGAASPGVVREIRAEPDGLHIRVEVDDAAAAEIRAGRYRYMSAEYHDDYAEKLAGEMVGPTLLGVALTNQPAHPGVVPIALSDGKWVQAETPASAGGGNDGKGDAGMGAAAVDGKVDLSEVLGVQLSEARAALEVAKAEAERAKAEAAEAKKLSDAARTETEGLRKAAREREVTAFCDEWTGKGIPPAVVDKIRPVLLADAATVKLSDGREADLKALFGALFEAVPRVPMGAKGDPGATKDPAAEAKTLADDIAARANARRQPKKA